MSDDKLSYDELRERLARAEAVLESLRRGEVDLVIGTAEPLLVRFKSIVEENTRLVREWQATFDSMNDAVWILDAEQRVLRSNLAAERIFQRPAKEMTGKHCWEVFHGTQEALPECPTVRMRKSLRRERMEWQVGDRWLEVRVDPILDENNRLSGAVHVVSDVTEQLRISQEQALLQKQLQQAQKMESIGRLAGGVAHDFNNLLTVINGYSRLLLDALSAGDPLRASLEQIHRAGERAAGLTGQLLAFSRKQVLQPRVLDLNRVVREMHPMLARLVGEDVEMRVELNAENGTVRADPYQLEQVVMNLAANARDAMPDGGKLLIETAGVEFDERQARAHPEARPGRYVMLAVSDTGMGMDQETQRQVFEPFFTTKGAVGKGTGLGLPMVQGIVAQSGGHIQVCSEPGRGTTFKVYLPRVEGAAEETGTPEAGPALGGTETVLVVEDEAEVRAYAVRVLKGYGYRVIAAAGAGEAAAICEREGGRIDLLLCDVVLPGLSGRKLAGRLKRLQPGIKVLFMSGYSDNVLADRGILDEGFPFLQKPFGPEQLAVRVREVLGSPKSGARILVADDEAGVRSFLRAALEQVGYEVIEAADGKQAIQQARAAPIDLIVTDLIMPEQEGIETIRILRKEEPSVGIIVISGACEGVYLEVAEKLGADAVLTKPVSAELLRASVAGVLMLRRRGFAAGKSA